jgi:hypothetical protein
VQLGESGVASIACELGISLLADWVLVELRACLSTEEINYFSSWGREVLEERIAFAKD